MGCECSQSPEEVDKEVITSIAKDVSEPKFSDKEELKSPGKSTGRIGVAASPGTGRSAATSNTNKATPAKAAFGSPIRPA